MGAYVPPRARASYLGRTCFFLFCFLGGAQKNSNLRCYRGNFTTWQLTAARERTLWHPLTLGDAAALTNAPRFAAYLLAVTARGCSTCSSAIVRRC